MNDHSVQIRAPVLLTLPPTLHDAETISLGNCSSRDAAAHATAPVIVSCLICALGLLIPPGAVPWNPRGISNMQRRMRIPSTVIHIEESVIAHPRVSWSHLR